MPLVCGEKQLNYCVSLDETLNTEALCLSRFSMIKIPPCSKALVPKHRSTFCSTSPSMMMSSYERNILEGDVQQHRIKQSTSLNTLVLIHVFQCIVVNNKLYACLFFIMSTESSLLVSWVLCFI